MTDKMGEIDEMLTKVRAFADEVFGSGAVVLMHFAKLEGNMIQPMHTATNMTNEQLSALLCGLASYHVAMDETLPHFGDVAGSC